MNRNYLFTASLFFCFSIIHATAIIRSSTSIPIREGNSIALISAANPSPFLESKCHFDSCVSFHNVAAGFGNGNSSTYSKSAAFSKLKSGKELFKIKSQEGENINKLNN